MRPDFRMFGPGLDPMETLCVDGRAFGLRCLSHWPGPPVPSALAHDLTTGMALRWARASEVDRESWLGSFRVLTNDHYDTDGALAMFSILDPPTALAHEDLLLRAAALGDFRTWQGEDALAVDLTLWAALGSPDSPLRARLGTTADYSTRAELGYRWMFEQLPSLLQQPFRWSALWRPRFDRILAERGRLGAGGIRVERHDACDLAVVYIDEPTTRHTIIAAAGDLHRVLIVHVSDAGCRYRFTYRNESWFLGIRDRTAPRRPLEHAMRALAQLEEGRQGEWWCTSIDRTSPQLGFGPRAHEADVFGDFRVDLDPVSRLPADVVVATLLATLTEDYAPGGNTQ